MTVVGVALIVCVVVVVVFLWHRSVDQVLTKMLLSCFPPKPSFPCREHVVYKNKHFKILSDYLFLINKHVATLQAEEYQD